MHEFNFIEWLGDKAGLEKYTDPWVISVIDSLLIFVTITIISVVVWLRLRRSGGSIVPSGKINLQNMMEYLVEWLLETMKGIIGEGAERFLPLIGTLFIYIFLSNLLGFIPGFVSPTSIITTNFGCALVVFIYYNYVGIKENGLFGYLRHFLGPVIWLAPLFLFVELVSHLVRPLTLSVRLYGNMMGDHLVLGIFSGLVPLVVPVIFICLGVFISLIQAFIFSTLSTVYIALAIQHE